MPNANNSESDETPKTQLILSHLAEQGPKTEYDLYKQLPNLSHGTIHFCLNKLHQDGCLTLFNDSKENQRKKKLFQLTFRGVILYLNTLHLDPLNNVEALKLFKNTSLEDIWKAQEQFQEQFIVEHLDEFENLTHVLEDCGKRIDYPLFKEIPWLVNHFGHSVLYDILYSAQVLEAVPPHASIELAFIGKKIEEGAEIVNQLKWASQSDQEDEIQRSIEQRNSDADDYNQLVTLNQQLKETQKELSEMILNSKSATRNDSWRQAFAANFAKKFLMSDHIPKAKEDSQNEVLRRFFSQIVLAILQEVVPSNKMVEFFSGQP